MTGIEKLACPLCASPATYNLFDFGKRKAIDCDTCGQFVIAAIAEHKLSNPLGNNEQKLSEYVKKNQGIPEMIPEIRTENGSTGEKQIVAELLNRAILQIP